MTTTDSAPDFPTDPMNRVKLIAAWTFVGIPLIWGVGLTFGNALSLFR